MTLSWRCPVDPHHIGGSGQSNKMVTLLDLSESHPQTRPQERLTPSYSQFLWSQCVCQRESNSVWFVEAEGKRCYSRIKGTTCLYTFYTVHIFSVFGIKEDYGEESRILRRVTDPSPSSSPFLCSCQKQMTADKENLLSGNWKYYHPFVVRTMFINYSLLDNNYYAQWLCGNN